MKSKEQKSSTRNGRCFRCNKGGHFGKDKCCPAKTSVCRKCKKNGHFAVVCKTKSANPKGHSNKSTGSNKPDVSQFTGYVDTNDEDEALGVVMICACVAWCAHGHGCELS